MKNNRKSILGTILVLLAAACWSIIGLFVRTLSEAGLDVWDITLVRIGVGLLAMAVYLILFHRELFRIRLRDLWCFAGAGILSLLCMNFCYNQAVQVTSLALAGTLLYTAPTFVMLMSLLLYSIFGRFALDRGYNSWTVTFYSFAFCALGCLLLARPGEIFAAAAARPALLVTMALHGLITGFAAFVLYTNGLRFLETGRASVVASLELVFGALVGLIAYGEAVSADALAGIVLILGAVAILSGEKK